MAAMPVPETAMGKENSLVSRKNDIRLTRQGAIMQPEPETGRMQSTPQHQLRFSVLTPDARHHPAAHFRGNDVRHKLPLRESQGVSP